MTTIHTQIKYWFHPNSMHFSVGWPMRRISRWCSVIWISNSHLPLLIFFDKFSFDRRYAVKTYQNHVLIKMIYWINTLSDQTKFFTMIWKNVDNQSLQPIPLTNLLTVVGHWPMEWLYTGSHFFLLSSWGCSSSANPAGSTHVFQYWSQRACGSVSG